MVLRRIFTSQNSYESEIKIEDDVRFLMSVTWKKCIFKFCLHQAFNFLFSAFTLGEKKIQCNAIVFIFPWLEQKLLDFRCVCSLIAVTYFP